MRKRPLCVALLLWIVIILFGYGKNDVPKERQGEKMTVTCQVQEIVGQEDSPVLYVRDVYQGKQNIASQIILYSSGGKNDLSKLRIGNVIMVHCSLYSFSKPGNPGQFDEFHYYQEQGIEYRAFVDKVTIIDASYYYLQEMMRQMRRQLYLVICRCANARDAGIVGAMLLGEKNDLSKEVKRLYKENGIAHILAISGLHISLIGTGLFFLLRRFVMPMHMAAIVSGVLLVLYGILTGGSVSTMRAITMMLCMLGARFLGKRYDALSALSLSALIQLIPHPLYLYDIGFLLSYGTVFGIIVFVKKFSEIVSGNPPWWQLIAGSLGIQIVTLPIILSAYYEIPLYGIVVNIIALPLVGFVLVGALGSIGMSFLSLWLGQFCFGIVHYILFFYDWICTFFTHLPNHQLIIGCPSPWQIISYYGMLLWWLYAPHKEDRKIHHVVLPLAIVILCFFPNHNVDKWQITNLDVGQGDCTCIRTPSTTILVDGGSSDVTNVGQYRIAPFLKYNGIRKIDYFFITHSDDDHTNGLLEIMEDSTHMGFDIGAIVLPKLEKKDENYKKIVSLCIREGISLCYMEKGNQLTVDNLQIRCQHPYAQYDWVSENDYSLVLELQYEDFRGLLTGDLEQAGESAIQEQCQPVTYLKVAHHGSRNSTSEQLLAQIQPQMAVISCGKKNRYGHPHEETRKRLLAVGTKVYRTDQIGAVQVSGENVEAYLKK